MGVTVGNTCCYYPYTPLSVIKEGEFSPHRRQILNTLATEPGRHELMVHLKAAHRVLEHAGDVTAARAAPLTFSSTVSCIS